MKKELTIDGKLYRLVEEKPELKVGEWYVGLSECLRPRLYLGDNKGVGFSHKEVWGDASMRKPELWQPANMEEVEKLLIKEAEKRYSEECRIKSMKHIGTENNMSKGNYEDRLTDEGLYFRGNLTFSFKSGKWAEIIEEEKPLYTNSYGREYYDGDKYTCFVLRSKFREDPIENLFNELNFDDGKLVADFIGTKKECYQYLADNCEE